MKIVVGDFHWVPIVVQVLKLQLPLDFRCKIKVLR